MFIGPPPYAGLGTKNDTAINYARAEWQAFPDADDRAGARRLAIELCLLDDQTEGLRDLLQDRRTHAAVEPLQRAEVAWLLQHYGTWALEVGFNIFRWWELDLALVALASFCTGDHHKPSKPPECTALATSCRPCTWHLKYLANAADVSPAALFFSDF